MKEKEKCDLKKCDLTSTTMHPLEAWLLFKKILFQSHVTLFGLWTIYSVLPMCFTNTQTVAFKSLKQQRPMIYMIHTFVFWSTINLIKSSNTTKYLPPPSSLYLSTLNHLSLDISPMDKGGKIHILLKWTAGKLPFYLKL